jgi:hypothetical protein
LTGGKRGVVAGKATAPQVSQGRHNESVVPAWLVAYTIARRSIYVGCYTFFGFCKNNGAISSSGGNFALNNVFEFQHKKAAACIAVTHQITA